MKRMRNTQVHPQMERVHKYFQNGIHNYVSKCTIFVETTCNAIRFSKGQKIENESLESCANGLGCLKVEEEGQRGRSSRKGNTETPYSFLFCCRLIPRIPAPLFPYQTLTAGLFVFLDPVCQEAAELILLVVLLFVDNVFFKKFCFGVLPNISSIFLKGLFSILQTLLSLQNGY